MSKSASRRSARRIIWGLQKNWRKSLCNTLLLLLLAQNTSQLAAGMNAQERRGSGNRARFSLPAGRQAWRRAVPLFPEKGRDVENRGFSKMRYRPALVLQ